MKWQVGVKQIGVQKSQIIPKILPLGQDPKNPHGASNLRTAAKSNINRG